MCAATFLISATDDELAHVCTHHTHTHPHTLMCTCFTKNTPLHTHTDSCKYTYSCTDDEGWKMKHSCMCAHSRSEHVLLRHFHCSPPHTKLNCGSKPPVHYGYWQTRAVPPSTHVLTFSVTRTERTHPFVSC